MTAFSPLLIVYSWQPLFSTVRERLESEHGFPGNPGSGIEDRGSGIWKSRIDDRGSGKAGSSKRNLKK